jgi:hypothetical protein
MGEVYKARDTRLDRVVAIKVAAEQFSDRFMREARAVATLHGRRMASASLTILIAATHRKSGSATGWRDPSG